LFDAFVHSNIGYEMSDKNYLSPGVTGTICQTRNKKYTDEKE